MADLKALCISYNEANDSASSPELPHSPPTDDDEEEDTEADAEGTKHFLMPPSSVERVLSPATSTDADSDVSSRWF